jgi:hypothetical protein
VVLGFELKVLPLEPCLQLILLWLFYKWDLTNYLLRLVSNHDFPDPRDTEYTI